MELAFFYHRLIQTSPQVDIVVYEDTDVAPMFRAGDLVVVLPEQVRGLIEVKKNLKHSDIDEIVDKYIFSNTGSELPRATGVQTLIVFSYQTRVPIETCYQRTVQALDRNLAKLSSTDNPGRYTSVPHITVPRFYFLGTPYFVNASVTPSGMAHKVEVSIQGILYSNGGASDLFSRFVWRGEMEQLDRVRFNTLDLYEPRESTVLKRPVILRMYASVQQICSGLDESELKRLKTRSLQQIVGFLIPYGFRVRTADELVYAIRHGYIKPLTDDRSKDGESVARQTEDKSDPT